MAVALSHDARLHTAGRRAGSCRSSRPSRQSTSAKTVRSRAKRAFLPVALGIARAFPNARRRAGDKANDVFGGVANLATLLSTVPDNAVSRIGTQLFIDRFAPDPSLIATRRRQLGPAQVLADH